MEDEQATLQSLQWRLHSAKPYTPHARQSLLSGSMPLVDELQGLAVQAQAAATKQGDTVRSLKASLKDGKAEKARTHATFIFASVSESQAQDVY